MKWLLEVLSSFGTASLEVESASLEGFKRCVGVALGVWISGGFGSSGLSVGLHGLGAFFQPK